MPEGLGNITSLKVLDLSATAIKELPSSIEFFIGLTSLDPADCKNFVLLPSTICSLKSLYKIYLSRCSKIVNLSENLENLKDLVKLFLCETAIVVLPSSIGHLTTLKKLCLRDCKNLVCLPSTICSLKMVQYLNITRYSKIVSLPENLGNMESLDALLLGGTAIKQLPSSTVHLKRLTSVVFEGSQLSSSSFDSMPTSHDPVGVLLRNLPYMHIKKFDLSDCNPSAIPSNIDCLSSLKELHQSGNDFASLPESVSQLSSLTILNLSGGKRLQSLSNIPSKVHSIGLHNCTSLERLPEPQNDF